MKRIMGYILIAVGIASIIGGIVMLVNTKKNDNETISLSSSDNRNTASVSSVSNGRDYSSNGRDYSSNGRDYSSNGRDYSSAVAEISQSFDKGTSESVESGGKNSNKEKGDKFEDFVVNLLADWRLKLLDRTQDKVSTSGVVAESCKNPDLHVQQKRGNSKIDYYLECKYRSAWKDDAVTFDDYQMSRYRKFQRDNHRKVVIVLGVGGSPSKPSTLMLVPIDEIKGNTIKRIKTQYVIQATPDALYQYMDSYFSEVFNKAKSKTK